MGKQNNRDSGEYAFTRAGYDELMEAQAAYSVHITTMLAPAERKGIWCCSVVAEDAREGAEAHPVVSYAAYWPNSTPQSFGAFLYGCQHRVARMVESWYQSNTVSLV